MISALDRPVIVDTGPLVALLVRDERHHAWVTDQLRRLRAPLLTCEPVLTECYHLLRKVKDGEKRFFSLLESGLLVTRFELLKERVAVARLVRQYRDLPMSLADACLVRMAELTADATVFTLDAHFRVYRLPGRRSLNALLPPG